MPPKKLTKSELIIKVAELQNIIDTYQHEHDETNSSTLQNIKDGAITADGSSPTMITVMDRLSCLEFTVNRLEKENLQLKKYVKNLEKASEQLEDNIYYVEKDLSSLQQYSRRWNVEICNIPEDVIQDHLEPKIVCALNQMEVPITGDDIEIVHRLSKPTGSNNPANVIVRFKNRNKAYLVMKNKRKATNIEKNTVSPNLKRNLFFQENLCPHYREIFDFCKLKKDSGDLHKVWTFKGLVHILFSDTVGEKVTKISHYSDLWDLFPDD